ncbi:sugar phosphorylase [Sulfitobacter geojensis]|uniref:Alpha-amylase n=1 Tax=Sulfitobacter geojensis TaxID=1342299 RepID=A0AAE2VYQ2_9RHOB|nr:sugar phosphorylase [Sulfitobacter geojensis]MBM1689518.1 alpha-amylase [Sulfitobacter geojensis]MBM1693584.1 alpha-amylase [Sulfitobacter geojensis]MBM1705750.1 alpha-amylase [Sulfitobacter geojensis]MBM1709808.1 alpha-amylase [Sulfitobacter geojensis]MBM1713874.1 alpha-amylase [Sulfitobacter geojensis]
MTDPARSIGPKLAMLLGQIYPNIDSAILSSMVLEAFWPDGKPRRQRGRRRGNSLWSQKDALLITYGNSITDGAHKPLDLLSDFLDRYLKDSLNAVHILPFFPYTSDDGFAVSDFRSVNPQLGDWPDINRIAQEFTLMSDLVLNHVSSQSNWFNAYRQGQAPYDKFFFEASPDDDLRDVVRPRTTPLLREVETSNGPRHVWCTFSHDQADLDFRNPEVLLEFLRIIRLHIDNGVQIIRLDAVAFLWKEIGTSSIHLPQTHAVIKLMRLLCDFATEKVILLTETNVPKAENLSYFGLGDEAHAIYNFPLPPLILHAMMSGNARYLRQWQRGMPPAPMGCAYLNFTASHDGIGMRPAEGILPDDEKQAVIDTVRDIGGLVSMRTMPDGSESPYELNTTFYDAMSRTFAGPDTHQHARFICSQTIVMSLEGIPAFYIHAMLATANDHDGVVHRGMNRAINRHRWDYPSLRALLSDPTTPNARVLADLSARLKIRQKQAAFHPNATQFTVNMGDERVFGIWRQSLDRHQSVFALHNVSDAEVSVPAAALNLIEDQEWVDLLSGAPIDAAADELTVAPYQCMWISNRT